MCGISGLVNWGDRGTLAAMNHVQAHRGPDDHGVWEHKFPDGSYIGLGSQRLAILDLSSAGHMPMGNEEGSVCITYNGEIYNFAALRRELEGKGHRFRSTTDTEVILRLYEEEGVDCVKRLEGMFAFAICDLRSGTPSVFMARDHFGIKPLYYVERGHRFAFASEIKALLQVPGVAGEMDHQALHQYLAFLWVPDPNTMFRGILKIPAGHCAIFSRGQLQVRKYWDLGFPAESASFPRSEDELAVEVRERFRTCVNRQLVSDVPVGAFLSAGVDSSSIVAMMAQSARQPVRTYTITYPKEHRVGETALDDPEVASRFARALGCEHHELIVEPQVADLMPKLTWHMDEPTADPAIIAAYLVCREASKSATVLLSGIGGDELFAGYRKYVAHYWRQAYRRIPGSIREGIDASLLRLPGLRGSRLKGYARLAKKMARSARLKPIEAFVRDCTYLDASQRTAIYTSALRSELSGKDGAIQHQAAFQQSEGTDWLNQMLYADLKIFMPSLNLAYNDKMSMASSVEVRVPFLDREFAEFVSGSVPPSLKLKGKLLPETKYIFRKAMKDMLPREILRQPKAGFGAPVDYWLAHDMKEMVDDLLSERQVKKRGLFQPQVVNRFICEHRQGKKDWSMQIWQFVTLELWMQSFLDQSRRVDRLPELATA